VGDELGDVAIRPFESLAAQLANYQDAAGLEKNPRLNFFSDLIIKKWINLVLLQAAHLLLA